MLEIYKLIANGTKNIGIVLALSIAFANMGIYTEYVDTVLINKLAMMSFFVYMFMQIEANKSDIRELKDKQNG